MAGARGVNIGHGNISVSPVLVTGFGGILQQQLNGVRNPSIRINPRLDNRQLNGAVGDTQNRMNGLRTAFLGAFAALSTRSLLDTGNQFSGLSNKITLVAAGATAAASAVGPLVGLVAGLGAAGTVAGTGLGAVFALAKPQFTAIQTAVKAVTDAQDKQVKSTNNVASAQRSLASARRGVLSADRGVVSAERGIDSARRAAAQTELADEESISRALDGVKTAQQGVNEARQQALLDLKNLREEQDRNNLSVREAELNLQQQRIDTARTMSADGSTALDKQFAQLHLDQAVQQLKDVQEAAADSKTQFDAAKKAGVDGAAGVVSATKQQQDAELSLADARRQQANDRIQAADQMKSAQDSLISAEDSLASANDSVASAFDALKKSQDDANGSTDDAAAALAKLTPMQRAAANATLELQQRFKDLSDKQAGPLLGAYISGVHTVEKLLPSLGTLAGVTGTALQGLFQRANAAVGIAAGPGGALTRFLGLVETQIGPVLDSAATTVVNLGRTIGNVFSAAVPVMMPALNVVKNLTGALSNASGGQGLIRFFSQVQPLLVPLQGTVQAVGRALGSLVQAALPLAGPVLNAVHMLADALHNLFTSAAFGTFVRSVGSAINSLAPLFNQLVGPIGQIIATISTQFASLAPQIVPVIAQFAQTFADAVVGLSPLLPMFLQLASTLTSFLPVLYPIVTAFRDALVPVMGALNAALIQMQPSIATIVGAFIQLLPLFSQVLVAIIPLAPALLAGLVPAMQAFAGAVQASMPLLNFLSDHIQTIATVAIPLLVAGLIAHKAAQAGSNLMETLALPIKAAELAANFALASANRALAFQLSILTGQQQAGRLATLGHTLAIVGQRIAQFAIAAATRAWAIAQGLLNAVMNANPFVLVGALIAALVVGIIEAYKHSETFRNIVQATWQGIQNAVSWAWNNVLKPIFGALKAAWSGLMTAFKAYWDFYAHPVLNAFASTAGWLWHSVLSPVFGWIGNGWHALGSGMRFVYDHTLRPIFDAFGGALNWLVGAFKSAVNGIRGHWDQIKGVFATPVNFVIRVVNGFDRIVNDIVSKVLPGNPRPLPEKIPQFAKGGLAQPGWAVVGEQGPELVNFSQPGRVYTAQQSAKMAGNGLTYGGPMSNNPGGEVGGPLSLLKSGAKVLGHGISSAVHGIGSAANWVFEQGSGLLRAGAADAVSGAFRTIADPIFNMLPKTFVGDWAKNTATSTVAKVVDWVRGKEAVPGVGDYSGAPGQSFPDIIRVMQKSGLPFLVNSTTGGGHAKNSYHYRGMAVDFGAPGNAPGPLAAIAKYWMGLSGNLIELIHSGGGGFFVKNGQRVGGGVYSSVLAEHYNHVHVAATEAAMQRILNPGSASAAGGYAGGGLKALAQQMLVQRGWGNQFPALDYIISHESSWNPNAKNPGSTAYGLGQLLAGTAPRNSDPRIQLSQMLQYISGRYGDPNNAERFWQSHHWYDDGGWLMPGATMAMNGTGKPEAIFTSEQLEALTGAAAGGGRGGPAVNIENFRPIEAADYDLLARKTVWAQQAGSFE